MATPRITLSIPEETREFLDQLKRDKYYNTSWSEMYCDVMRKGVEAVEAEMAAEAAVESDVEKGR